MPARIAGFRGGENLNKEEGFPIFAYLAYIATLLTLGSLRMLKNNLSDLYVIQINKEDMRNPL